MKRFRLAVSLLVFVPVLWGKQQYRDEETRTIAVPVRVLDGERFVDNLTIDDIELSENGHLEKIQTLILVDANRIVRKEGFQEKAPILSRRFYFLFQISEYDPQISDAIAYFFHNIYQPGDQIVMMTPSRNYTLSPESFRIKSREIIISEIQRVIRKDITWGSTEYNNIMTDLKGIVRLISVRRISGDTQEELNSETQTTGSLTELYNLMSRYMDRLQNLEALRLVDQEKLIRFAFQLKKLRQQKHVFLFYQREFRPEIHPSIYGEITSFSHTQPIIQDRLQDLFQFYRHRIELPLQRLIQVYADSSAVFNLIFFSKPTMNFPGIVMQEQSEDTFQAFSRIAFATGGIVDNSQNPEAALRKAAETTDNYYLLLYTPQKYIDDGGFRTIKIFIKNKQYSVRHRLGYFAF